MSNASARFSRQVELMALEPSGLVDGWGIYSGCEGEDPSFVGFIVHEDTAQEIVRSASANGEFEQIVFDGQTMPAILTEYGVVTSNDYEINTHAKLRAKYAESWWEDGRLITGCIGPDLQCGCPKCISPAAKNDAIEAQYRVEIERLCAELEAATTRGRELVEEAEERAEALQRKLDDTSALAATLIGHACERHLDEVRQLSFPEFVRAHPQGCHWCDVERMRDLERELAQTRMALEEQARQAGDLVKTAVENACFPLEQRLVDSEQKHARARQSGIEAAVQHLRAERQAAPTPAEAAGLDAAIASLETFVKQGAPTAKVSLPWHEQRCHSDDDGYCAWEECPQLRDNEPATSSRHCPLDRRSEIDEASS